MGGFPFMAIGAGLGQGAQQINQGNESQLRQMMARLMQQQQQREMAAKGLMGEALMAGDIPGLSGGGGMGGFGGGAGGLNLPGTTRLPGAPGSMPAYSTLPDGTMDPRAASPPFMGNQPGGNTPAPISQFTEQPPPMSGPAMAPSPAAQQTPVNLPDLMESELTDPLGEPSAASAARREPQISYDAGPAQVAPGAAPEAESAVGSADAAPTQQAAPATPQEIPAYLSMFQHVDPTAIAARIKAIRPDADPAAVAMATESLYKMAQGGMREQMAAASMMKFMIGNQTKQDLFAKKEAGVEGRSIRKEAGVEGRSIRTAGTAAQGRASREGIADKNRSAAMERTRVRLDARAAEAEAKAPKEADKQAFREMRGRVADLKKRIDAIDMGPVTAETKAHREALGKQMDDMLGALQKRTDSILGKMPAGAE